VKKLSPNEVIANQIGQLDPGQSLSYRLPETFGGGLAVVELNTEYPGKGKKYVLSTDKIVEGKPAGKRSRIWDSDKPKDIAGPAHDVTLRKGGQPAAITEPLRL
jgi:hypothetical protein